MGAAVRAGGLVRSSEGLSLERTLAFATARRRVFEALVRTGMWWPHRARRRARVVLESRIGGRFYEDWGDGFGLLYGHVEVMAPPSQFCIRGPLILPEPLLAVWSLALSEPERHHTQVHAIHTVVGTPDDEMVQLFVKAWDDVYDALGGYLRRSDLERRDR